MSEIVERYSTAIDIYSSHRPQPKLATHYIIFKIILLVTNLIFMVFGCALIGVGTYALNTKANDLLGHTLPSGLIVMGVFVLLLSGIGAISAWKESRLGLAIYLVFLLIITIILFSIGVAVVVENDRAGLYIEEAWSKAPNDVKTSIQLEFDCCGLKAYNESSVWPCPPSSESTRIGCYDKLVGAFNTAYSHAGGTGIAFSIIMGLGIIFVVCLMTGIKRKQSEEQMHQVRAANDGLSGDLDSTVDLDSIDAGAASMFDKDGYVPETHNPVHMAQQQRRKK